MKILAPLILALTTSAWAKTSQADLLESLEKSFTERAVDFPAPDDAGLLAGDRLTALLHLRYLTTLESILGELNTTEETLKKQLEINGLSGSEKNAPWSFATTQLNTAPRPWPQPTSRNPALIPSTKSTKNTRERPENL